MTVRMMPGGRVPTADEARELASKDACAFFVRGIFGWASQDWLCQTCGATERAHYDVSPSSGASGAMQSDEREAARPPAPPESHDLDRFHDDGGPVPLEGE